MKLKYIGLCAVLGAMFCCQAPTQKMPQGEVLSQMVNPFIGSDGPGNTYPGATLPFGMVQLSPDIGIPGWDRIAGYFYQDSLISGFSHTHLSGTGAGDLYDILVMPTNSRFAERISENGGVPFSYFNHQSEKAQAGYYRVFLESFGIDAELTATRRVGVQRYVFPKDEHSKVHVNLGFAMNWDAPTQTHLKVVDSLTLEGFRKSTGWAKDQRVYFVMKFSKPFASYQIFNEENKMQNNATAQKLRIELLYNTQENDTLIVKTGLSTADVSGAYAALQTEAPHFHFEAYKEDAARLWEEQLSKIEITTPNQDLKSLFYTMLYQTMLAPTLLSDANGNYKGADGQNHHTTTERYDTFSLWDTFRAAHPLYTVLHPEKVQDFIASMLQHYQQTGTLPVWSMQGNETHMMIGYHAVPVIVDAYFKNIPMDVPLAYEACLASARAQERDIPQYTQKGYIATDARGENWGVSKTLEYAYDDWCIAQFAQALGKSADAQEFEKRSEYWRNVFDPATRFMRPKDSLGNFVKPFIPKEYTPYFCESNAWHYLWFVPQNVSGLIQAMGGETLFEQRLDSMFSYAPSPEDKLPIFSTGMIGQYAHGNEPSHHVAYLYNYIGKPHKTQQRVREILQTQYRNQPNGHCGNEDCGQMSAWYVFSALGLYPVNPANGEYQLGTPLFQRSVIHLPNGKDFVIQAQHFTPENPLVKEVLLNGKKLNRTYLTHKEIMQGGTLTFVMQR